MLYYLNQRLLKDPSNAYIEKVTGIPIEGYPQDVFRKYILEHDINLNKNKLFSKLNASIDNASIPMPYVLQDMHTLETHTFDESTMGVYACWLLYNCKNRMWRESQWFDPRCYSTIISLSSDTDVYIYDDTDMYLDREWRSISEGLCYEFSTKHVLSMRDLTKYVLKLSDEGALL